MSEFFVPILYDFSFFLVEIFLKIFDWGVSLSKIIVEFFLSNLLNKINFEFK